MTGQINRNSSVADWRLAAQEAAQSARQSGAKALSEISAKAVLSSHGVSTPLGKWLARPEDATENALGQLTPPLVAKLVTRAGVHKSDFGGVQLNLNNAAEVSAALSAINAAAAKAGIEPDGFLVEEQAAPGVELVLGGVFDPRFGPCVMVGLGGVFVEIFEDVAFRVCPIDENEAREMLAELKARPILSGVRGRDGVDVDALVAALVAFGGPRGVMMAFEGQAVEIDVNPLIAGPGGAVAADARIMLSASANAALEPAPPIDMQVTREMFRPLFRPKSIAILGASSSGSGFGNEVISHSLAFGYQGRITPIHPTASEIQGLKTSQSFASMSEPVDFAYVAIGADAALEALGTAPNKAHFVQVMSSGFGESQDTVKERRLLEIAKANGFRLLGPNCLGVHSPRGGLTFVGGADSTPGNIGVISQSGGLAVDVILKGGARGLKFSAVTTLGNSADLTPADLLEHHFADPETDVIGLYLEDVRDGRRFVQRLKEHACEKPVVMLVGGRTEAGGALLLRIQERWRQMLGFGPGLNVKQVR
ncbi:acetate--CoA ligase family protein [Rhodobacteraceae bacterium D3-12]|nr:acetate--CoA ligase family protein [Rhodobacteraceae bacterium D3-12]